MSEMSAQISEQYNSFVPVAFTRNAEVAILDLVTILWIHGLSPADENGRPVRPGEILGQAAIIASVVEVDGDLVEKHCETVPVTRVVWVPRKALPLLKKMHLEAKKVLVAMESATPFHAYSYDCKIYDTSSEDLITRNGRPR